MKLRVSECIGEEEIVNITKGHLLIVILVF